MDRNSNNISFRSTAAAVAAAPTTTTTTTTTNIIPTHNYNKLQTLVFIRHGIAIHNITQNYTDPNMIDSPLVIDGKVRSIQTGIDVKNWFRKQQQSQQQQQSKNNNNNSTGTGTGKIDLFITSPLTRCIQTMTIAFLPGDDYDEIENNENDIEDCDDRGNSTDSSTKTIKPIIPSIICHENVREAYGIHYSDKRRSKSLLKNYWPLIDFDTVPMSNSNDDELWNNRTQRETLTEVLQRIQNFIEYWLIQRSETNIVIITHGVWIECLLRQYYNNSTVSSSSDSQHILLQRRVHNLDSISCQCYSKLISTTTTATTSSEQQQQQQQPQYEFVKLDQFELISTQYK